MVPTIRMAMEPDLPRILQILNVAIENTTAHWDLEPMAETEGRDWFYSRRGKGFPIIVADGADDIIGFATFDAFRPFQGFRQTAEHSIYVDPQAQRRGVGRALLWALMAHATELEMHALIAGIESGNEASLALHREAGFKVVGLLPQVGRKFDRWLDLVFMQRLLSGRQRLEPVPKVGRCRSSLSQSGKPLRSGW